MLDSVFQMELRHRMKDKCLLETKNFVSYQELKRIFNFLLGKKKELKTFLKIQNIFAQINFFPYNILPQ